MLFLSLREHKSAPASAQPWPFIDVRTPRGLQCQSAWNRTSRALVQAFFSAQFCVGQGTALRTLPLPDPLPYAVGAAAANDSSSSNLFSDLACAPQYMQSALVHARPQQRQTITIDGGGEHPTPRQRQRCTTAQHSSPRLASSVISTAGQHASHPKQPTAPHNVPSPSARTHHSSTAGAAASRSQGHAARFNDAPHRPAPDAAPSP